MSPKDISSLVPFYSLPPLFSFFLSFCFYSFLILYPWSFLALFYRCVLVGRRMGFTGPAPLGKGGGGAGGGGGGEG